MISKEEVLHIAKLARLELPDVQVQRMQKDLSAILDYFNVLKKVKGKREKVKGEKLAQNVVRKDFVMQKPASLANNLIGAAPDKKDGYIKVKAIL